MVRFAALHAPYESRANAKTQAKSKAANHEGHEERLPSFKDRNFKIGVGQVSSKGRPRVQIQVRDPMSDYASLIRPTLLRVVFFRRVLRVHRGYRFLTFLRR